MFLLYIALLTLGFGIVSAKFERAWVTPPMLFTAVGVVLSWVVTDAMASEADSFIEVFAELTLVVLLFTDASRIDVTVLCRERGLPIRLLGVGLPLTIALGAVVGKVLFSDFSWFEAALLGAILAPTDAALGQAVVSSPKVPLRIRQSLNVESGLNDGIALPVVMLFAALGAVDHQQAASATGWIGYWLAQVSLGPLVGVVVGLLAGKVVEGAVQRRWMTGDFHRLSGVAIAIIAWQLAIQVGGNGFIAAFVAGATVGCTARRSCEAFQQFGESEGQLLALATFTLFGLLMVIPAFQMAGAVEFIYAFLSLTLVRMLPVALSLVGTGVRPSTVLFLGWFGPRGLASFLFALFVVGEYDFEHGNRLFHAAIITVIASLIAHGISSVPGANAYARRIAHDADQAESQEHQPASEHPLRITPRGGAV